MKAAVTKTSKTSAVVNRWAYALYLVLVIYMFIIKDYSMALANLGITLVFDPFDAAVKWSDRPFYQRVWLCTHLFIVLGGFIILWLL